MTRVRECHHCGEESEDALVRCHECALLLCESCVGRVDGQAGPFGADVYTCSTCVETEDESP